MRTERTNGNATYTYTYNGSQLSQMTYSYQGSFTMHFYYDASGNPMSFTYSGATYYYVLNLQGDVVAILNSSGEQVVGYTYDARGKLLTTAGSMASTLGLYNPLRYRGYVYDRETSLYYLQSRYYNPSWGRFLNSDILVSTGQGIVGNNMFVYCGNNPVSRADSEGQFFNTVCGALVGEFLSAFTRQDDETFGEAFLRGTVTGAIAGAALDFSIATAGTGAAVAIAVIGGAAASAIDYGWEQKIMIKM